MKIQVTISETVIHQRTLELNLDDQATKNDIEEAIDRERFQCDPAGLLMPYDSMTNHTETTWIEYEDPRSQETVSYEA